MATYNISSDRNNLNVHKIVVDRNRFARFVLDQSSDLTHYPHATVWLTLSSDLTDTDAIMYSFTVDTTPVEIKFTLSGSTINLHDVNSNTTKDLTTLYNVQKTTRIYICVAMNPTTEQQVLPVSENLWVMDTMTFGTNSANYIPGCLNYTNTEANPFIGTGPGGFTFLNSNVLAVRLNGVYTDNVYAAIELVSQSGAAISLPKGTMRLWVTQDLFETYAQAYAKDPNRCGQEATGVINLHTYGIISPGRWYIKLQTSENLTMDDFSVLDFDGHTTFQLGPGGSFRGYDEFLNKDTRYYSRDGIDSEWISGNPNAGNMHHYESTNATIGERKYIPDTPTVPVDWKYTITADTNNKNEESFENITGFRPIGSGVCWFPKYPDESIVVVDPATAARDSRLLGTWSHIPVLLNMEPDGVDETYNGKGLHGSNGYYLNSINDSRQYNTATGTFNLYIKKGQTISVRYKTARDLPPAEKWVGKAAFVMHDGLGAGPSLQNGHRCWISNSPLVTYDESAEDHRFIDATASMLSIANWSDNNHTRAEYISAITPDSIIYVNYEVTSDAIELPSGGFAGLSLWAHGMRSTATPDGFLDATLSDSAPPLANLPGYTDFNSRKLWYPNWPNRDVVVVDAPVVGNLITNIPSDLNFIINLGLKYHIRQVYIPDVNGNLQPVNFLPGTTISIRVKTLPLNQIREGRPWNSGRGNIMTEWRVIQSEGSSHADPYIKFWLSDDPRKTFEETPEEMKGVWSGAISLTLFRDDIEPDTVYYLNLKNTWTRDYSDNPRDIGDPWIAIMRGSNAAFVVVDR